MLKCYNLKTILLKKSTSVSVWIFYYLILIQILYCKYKRYIILKNIFRIFKKANYNVFSCFFILDCK